VAKTLPKDESCTKGKENKLAGALEGLAVGVLLGEYVNPAKVGVSATGEEEGLAVGADDGE